MTLLQIRWVRTSRRVRPTRWAVTSSTSIRTRVTTASRRRATTATVRVPWARRAVRRPSKSRTPTASPGAYMRTWPSGWARTTVTITISTTSPGPQVTTTTRVKVNPRRPRGDPRCLPTTWWSILPVSNTHHLISLLLFFYNINGSTPTIVAPNLVMLLLLLWKIWIHNLLLPFVSNGQFTVKLLAVNTHICLKMLEKKKITVVFDDM